MLAEVALALGADDAGVDCVGPDPDADDPDGAADVSSPALHADTRATTTSVATHVLLGDVARPATDASVPMLELNGWGNGELSP